MWNTITNSWLFAQQLRNGILVAHRNVKKLNILLRVGLKELSLRFNHGQHLTSEMEPPWSISFRVGDKSCLNVLSKRLLCSCALYQISELEVYLWLVDLLHRLRNKINKDWTLPEPLWLTCNYNIVELCNFRSQRWYYRTLLSLYGRCHKFPNCKTRQLPLGTRILWINLSNFNQFLGAKKTSALLPGWI